ncbi:MAG: hypothetical protein H0V41_00010 [Pseudonocardiales bacterium]|nr:hypothetical protein [Pseudonocardiales bacterium]
MTTIVYVGFLVAPAGVGLAASLTSLPTALAAVAVVAVLLAVLAPTASWSTRWRRVHPR